MNRAFEAKQGAFTAQEQAWQDCQSVNERNGPRIERLNSDQERVYQNMKTAFDRASSAHGSHDGASAKAYAEEGHNYKAEAQRYVEERRRLVEECKGARTRHEPYKKTFNEAKIAFGRTKDEHEQAKAAHERANDEFKRAKIDFDSAAKAFQARLAELKSEYSKKKENNRAIAAKAGIPYQYRDNVYVLENPDGTVNIYFGGMDKPDGFGHGHYAMNSTGKVIYKRLPLESHGSHNYELSNGVYFGLYKGKPAKINVSDWGNSNHFDIYYGGKDTPDGTGHSNISVIKDNIRYWRDGNDIIIDDDN